MLSQSMAPSWWPVCLILPAVEASVQVVRAFVQLRQMLASNAELSRKLFALEKKYDIKFRAVFEAIHQLMAPAAPNKKRPIGFAPWEKK